MFWNVKMSYISVPQPTVWEVINFSLLGSLIVGLYTQSMGQMHHQNVALISTKASVLFSAQTANIVNCDVKFIWKLPDL